MHVHVHGLPDRCAGTAFCVCAGSAWDAVVVMFGSNDCTAHSASRAYASWRHCEPSRPDLLSRCPFARALSELLRLVTKRGRGGVSPLILTISAPPVVIACEQCACGLNTYCVNEVLPGVTREVHLAVGLPASTHLNPFQQVRVQYKSRPYACSMLAPAAENTSAHCNLFQCDRMHLTRSGNTILAAAVAGALQKHFSLPHMHSHR